MENEDGTAKMAKLNLKSDVGDQKTIPTAGRNNKKKFKDFTLDQKQLFSICTDEEVSNALKSSTPASSSPVNEDPALTPSERSVTEKGAPTFNTSGDARVDFFFHVLEQTDSEQTKSRLEKSWEKHSLHTLKLISVLRDIRDGKGIRSQYHDCLYWLYQNHPKTLYENLEELLKFGYWKDCLQLLLVICFEGYVHPHLKADDAGKANSYEPQITTTRYKGGLKRKNSSNKSRILNFHEKEIYNIQIAKHFGFKKTGHKNISKEKMTELRLQFAREKFQNDTKYRVFHVKVAQIFAKQLNEDLLKIQKNDAKDKKVSLAGKWAPSLEAHFDRYTLISTTIAIELTKLRQESNFDILAKPIPIAVYLSRKNYHKEFCVPLRKYQEVPELPMSAGEWDKVNYKRVPSKCMKRNKNSFTKHDLERFSEYLKKPESKIAGAALKPIEIITQAMQMNSRASEEEILVMEKQWSSLVENVKNKGGLLKSALAVCDVSGSMSGQPMLAAMGLTLITMSMCDEPWNSMCVTFHEDPSLHILDGNLSLSEKVTSLKSMPWGGTTDLQKVFDLILSTGLQNKLTQDQMPRVLLIFTDMEFDTAFPGTTLTNFEAAKEQFTKSGYTLPAIVFWNVSSFAGKSSTPVQVNEYGAVLVSGFSAQQLAYITQQDDISKCTPLQFVLEMLEKDQYNKLKIYD